MWSQVDDATQQTVVKADITLHPQAYPDVTHDSVAMELGESLQRELVKYWMRPQALELEEVYIVDLWHLEDYEGIMVTYSSGKREYFTVGSADYLQMIQQHEQQQRARNA